MTLDEAISHAEEVATTRCGECSEEHEQLAEWLRELKKLKAQNEWLRKECASLRKTREREFAASCEAATNSMGQIGSLRDKNAELRELVKDMWQTISKDDRCGWDMDANCCTSDECTVSCRYWYRMKELGIETDDD